MENNSEYVIVVSGKIASGKTTLVSYLVKEFGIPSTGFGKYLKSVAIERGLPDDRQTLQQLGQNLVENNVDAFCQAVLKNAGWPENKRLIVDGVRHQVVLDSLKKIIDPIKLVLIFVALDDSSRNNRMIDRGREGEQALSIADKDKTEIELSDLAKLADLTIDGSTSLNVNKNLIQQYLSTMNSNL